MLYGDSQFHGNYFFPMKEEKKQLANQNLGENPPFGADSRLCLITRASCSDLLSS